MPLHSAGWAALCRGIVRHYGRTMAALQAMCGLQCGLHAVQPASCLLLRSHHPQSAYLHPVRPVSYFLSMTLQSRPALCSCQPMYMLSGLLAATPIVSSLQASTLPRQPIYMMLSLLAVFSWSLIMSGLHLAPPGMSTCCVACQMPSPDF